jgi:2-polyprenyl-6-methoxyphenol hydroxylase-like FAD-dependent oxidoreductase
MTPNLGQGAAQSFEDVAVLALELRALPIAEALRAYEKARKRRAERIARQSRTIGRIFQASNPAVAWLRDAVASRTPVAVTARQFAGVLSR